jgi:amino acid transporter
MKKLRTVQLAAIIFLTVSGGPYGLEPLLSYAGEHAALLLLIITPLLWDIPTILTVLELNSMMPITGGYYQWVKRALGLRFAFYEGWWTWLYTFVDLAIYPVLFITYASYFFPQLAAYKIPVGLLIIWGSAFLNILGIVPVGRTSIVLGILVLIPFLVLFGYALWKFGGHFHIPSLSFKGQSFSNLGMGLYTVMWNFIGWDNTTTYAEEVAKPVRSYLKSIFIAFITVFSIYFIAILIAQTSGVDYQSLGDNGFPLVGTLLGGNWLGGLIAGGGMASALGLYSAVLLSVSRVPKVMADDRLLPAWLNRLHPKFNSPYISIIACSVVVSFMILWTFGDLLIIDVTLYGAALSLEFAALIKLRRVVPNEHRPFKIPLGIPGLLFMAIFPLTVYLFAIGAAFIDAGKTLLPVAFALAALASAELMWLMVKSKATSLR